jgi:GT2 family glycosyltransferase
VTDLTVAIVSHNAKNELSDCLSSIFATTRLAAVEVIVADNASADGTVAMLAERFPAVRVIALGENLGFGRASNLCWRQARSPFVLFLNGDTRLTDRALDRLVEILEARPEVGALGPRLRYSDGVLQMSFGSTPTLGSEFLQKCWNAGYARGRGPLSALVERRYASERAVDWVSGACLLTRRSLLESLSGFDESFFLYSEDVDLCARVRAAGLSILFTPEVEVVHLLGRSAERNRERALFESHRSRLHFYRKHNGAVSVGLLRLYMAAKAALAWVFRPKDRAVYRSVLKLALAGR